MIVLFTVPGEPQGKARARTVRSKNGKVHSFTPDKTAAYEKEIVARFREAYGFRIPFNDGEPVELIVRAFFPIPKRTSKKKIEKMLKGEIRPTKKPDIDNILKVVADALNDEAYKDDKQIAYMQCAKWYSDDPRIEIVVQSAEYPQGVGDVES